MLSAVLYLPSEYHNTHMCGWWCARCPCASMFIFTEYNPHHKLRRLYYYTRISRKFARDSKTHHPPLTRDQQITITRNRHAPPHTLAHNIRYVHIYMCANTSDFSIRAATCGAQRRREDWISALQSQLDFARKKRCNIFITQSAPPWFVHTSRVSHRWMMVDMRMDRGGQNACELCA